MKVLLHSLQVYLIPPCFDALCALRLLFVVNLASHLSHLCGFPFFELLLATFTTFSLTNSSSRFLFRLPLCSTLSITKSALFTGMNLTEQVNFSGVTFSLCGFKVKSRFVPFAAESSSL